MKKEKNTNSNAQSGSLNGVSVIKDYVLRLPSSAGVYRMLDKHGKVLYVGKAKDLKKRVSAYTKPEKQSVRIQRMIASTVSMEFVTTQSEAEALLLEANLIKRLKPFYNILLRDDKSSPYLHMSDHAFPRLEKHRGARKGKGQYYGPFANAMAVNETLHTLQKAFMLRNCSDNMFAGRKRPCLQYHIKRCTAPCVGKVSEDDYAQQVRGAQEFLSGKSNKIQEELAQKMYSASENMDYETAAMYRDRIAALTTIQARQDINAEGTVKDADILAIYNEGGQACIQVFFFRGGRNYGNRAHFPRHDKDDSEGEILSSFLVQFYEDKVPPGDILLSHPPAEKDVMEEALKSLAGKNVHINCPARGVRRSLVAHALDNARQAHARYMAQNAKQRSILEDIANLFDLDEPPGRIEVYDNSHISGTGMVGAMIVATPEGFDKKSYRKFNIKDDIEAGDDYAMMREVIRRRFERALKDDPGREKGQWPDLVLIDGGKGQYSAVAEVMAELGVSDITMVAISKGPDRNAGREQFHTADKTQTLPKNSATLFYLQNVRDEAHRFAIGAQRAKRSKAIQSSPLDSIQGIGAKRKKALLSHFGSAKAVSQARLEDLQQVSGVSDSVAQKVFDYFHET